MTTLKYVTDLADELQKLSSGEIRTIISNPTDRPGGEHVVISAFGQEYSLRNLTGAATLLELWKANLITAGFAALVKELLFKAHRAILFRTTVGGWRIDTQTVDGALVTDSWSVPTGTPEISLAVTAANNTLAEHKLTSAFGWVAFPERENMLVTFLLEA